MSRVAIIPARGGSRRIPRKNIRYFHGMPIMGYSIRAALESELFDGGVYVSSDDEEILRIALTHGAQILLRTEGLSRDEVGTQEVVAGELWQLAIAHRFRPSDVCCVYATVPMLSKDDLVEGYKLLRKHSVEYVFAVGAAPLRDAGMFYWGTREAFERGRPLVSINSIMYPIQEGRICDINEERDWKRAEEMYAALQRGVA